MWALALAATVLTAATPVTISVTPEKVQVVGLPCLPGSLKVGLTNTGTTDRYVDLELSAPSPVVLDRKVISTWLPAWDPDHTVVTPVGVSVPRTAKPGTYSLSLSVDRTRRTVPVEVLPLPPKDNLVLGEQASASSTHGSFRTCGAVDGDANSANWSTSTGWNDATRAVFPDEYSVSLVAPSTIGRVELQTLDSARYPAAQNGLRDWDVQVRVSGSWVTVDQVRGNVTGRVKSVFPAVQADAVRIVVLDSNDHLYSRIVELEAYPR
ncbi:discoidin domain-containing protein [Allokutzneria albata]|uniref:F5/8 type C domain-containing protein n=1 Tax=Allokutzneria albata TaxID=211114 RepID=A0A1H0BPJ3_ALLAB|nr:discoidin domain-containing protein [Allokutzneria albata]SDN47453.1 F5/8 type C domain-containing protein [Allokutzneria albata]